MRVYLQRGSQSFVLNGLWSRFARSYGCTSIATVEREPAEETPLEPAAAEEQATWVEVELVDMENQPIAGERYRITTPNGKTHEGRTDRTGLARLIGIPQDGPCDIVFPDLDEEAWEAA